MTKEHLHKLTDEKLPQALGAVLLNKCCCNCVNYKEKPHGCFSCVSNVSVKNPRGWITRPNEHCCLDFRPDPIPIDDFNIAMKWRDWCESKFRPSDFEDAMYSVYNSTKYHDIMTYSMWLLRKAKPKHYLLAAAICKLEGKTND
jgi:hypothetical protein